MFMLKSLKISTGVIRICKWMKDRQHNGGKKRDIKTIYKTLRTKLKIEQHEPNQNPGVNSGAPEGKAVPASLVAPVMTMLSQKVIPRFELRLASQV
jgi:hypothetical protein